MKLPSSFMLPRRKYLVLLTLHDLFSWATSRLNVNFDNKILLFKRQIAMKFSEYTQINQLTKSVILMKAWHLL